MLIYFAYGSNMDIKQMTKRVGACKNRGKGILHQHRFIINSCGVATVVPNVTSTVYGVGFFCTESQMIQLDGYEGVANKVYTRMTVSVLFGDRLEEVVIYTASEVRLGKPREGYLERILVAIEHWEFPKDYFDSLQALQ